MAAFSYTARLKELLSSNNYWGYTLKFFGIIFWLSVPALLDLNNCNDNKSALCIFMFLTVQIPLAFFLGRADKFRGCESAFYIVLNPH